MTGTTNYEMHNVTWYSNHKSNHFRFSTDAEVDEMNDRKRRLRWLRRKQDQEAAEAYKLEHKNGYCPKCHCLLPLNGICDCE